MTKELAKPAEKPKALGLMAARLNIDPDKLLDSLKATVFKGASNEELVALVIVANEYDLNPFLKEIYAFPAKGGGIQPVVPVDGWTKIINRQPKLDGIEFDDIDDEDGSPIKKICSIWIKGRKKPVIVGERFKECFRPTEPWKQMPHRMLRHKALMQCARYAFGLSGIQDEDEARDTILNAQGQEKIPTFDLPQAPKDKPIEEETPLQKLRRKLAQHQVEEKLFCEGLALLGYMGHDPGDVYSLDELTESTLKQLVTQDMNKLLDAMEGRKVISSPFAPEAKAQK